MLATGRAQRLADADRSALIDGEESRQNLDRNTSKHMQVLPRVLPMRQLPGR
jgi:hypothetical protein